MNLAEISDRAIWDEFVSANAWGHPLQLWGWGETKRENGWTAHRLGLMRDGAVVAGVQVLLWPIPKLGRFVAYVPRGPVAEPGSREAAAVLEGLVAWARQRRALYVRIEPAWVSGGLGPGWVRARHHLQMRETYTIDLRQDEDVLLAPMSHKHRQYIRKSERDGVNVELVEDADLGAMYRMYAETAARAGFGIHGRGYYEALHRELGTSSRVYYAWYQGEAVAFLWLAVGGRTAYELYGGVTEVGQAMKANYALKWRAMMDMKAEGRMVYDFNGRLNEGVSRFKEGFGPAETDYIGTWDYPIGGVGYHVWEHLWPVVKVAGRGLARLRAR